MTLQLSTIKSSDAGAKLSLDLRKQEPFTINLSWEGANDLDLHSFFAINDGNGAKVSDFDDILSTYNVKRTIRGQTVGTLVKKSDGSFEIKNGAMVHSKDAEDGDDSDIDEFVKVYPDRLPKPASGHIEIPLIAMIHPQSGSVKFKDVKNPKIDIFGEDGRQILSANLSSEFGEFIGVQIGAIMISPEGEVQFAQVGVGFAEDFNQVLGYFS